MSRIVRTEVRHRGFFGKLMKWSFIVFNVAMLFFLFSGMAKLGEHAQDLQSDAERAGYGLGAAIGLGGIILFWAAGDIILGLFVILTRGKKLIIEEANS